MDGAPSCGKISTFIVQIARMEASAMLITATKMVIGRRIAENTSHMFQVLFVRSILVSAAERAADSHWRQPPLRGHARRLALPKHHRFPLGSRYAVPQQPLARW